MGGEGRGKGGGEKGGCLGQGRGTNALRRFDRCRTRRVFFSGGVQQYQVPYLCHAVFTGIHRTCILELHLDPSPAQGTVHCTLTLLRRMLCHFNKIFARSKKQSGSQDKLTTWP